MNMMYGNVTVFLKTKSTIVNTYLHFLLSFYDYLSGNRYVKIKNFVRIEIFNNFFPSIILVLNCEKSCTSVHGHKSIYYSNPFQHVIYKPVFKASLFFMPYSNKI